MSDVILVFFFYFRILFTITMKVKIVMSNIIFSVVVVINIIPFINFVLLFALVLDSMSLGLDLDPFNAHLTGNSIGIDDVDNQDVDMTLNIRQNEQNQAEKRAHHNALERKRRDHIKGSFGDLRDAIPSLKGEKV